MSESLYSQIAAAEDALRASEAQLGRVRNFQDAVAGLVGRGEAAEGRVVIECSSGAGVTNVELDPRAMRMQSVDLAAAIKTAIAAASADLQQQVREAVGSLGAGRTPSPEEVRAQLAAAREQFIGVAREAAGGLTQATRLLNDRQTR